MYLSLFMSTAWEFIVLYSCIWNIIILSRETILFDIVGVSNRHIENKLILFM